MSETSTGRYDLSNTEVYAPTHMNSLPERLTPSNRIGCPRRSTSRLPATESASRGGPAGAGAAALGVKARAAKTMIVFHIKGRLYHGRQGRVKRPYRLPAAARGRSRCPLRRASISCNRGEPRLPSPLQQRGGRRAMKVFVFDLLAYGEQLEHLKVDNELPY